MSAISHIFVLSQPEFVQRQVQDLFTDQSAAPSRWRIGGWLKKRINS